jgi:hypothetical protein
MAKRKVTESLMGGRSHWTTKDFTMSLRKETTDTLSAQKRQLFNDCCRAMYGSEEDIGEPWNSN